MMTPWIKGIVIAVVHVMLVVSVGAKFLYDRSVRPRVWAMTVPVDPDSPLRGRYVQLRLVVEALSSQPTKAEGVDVVLRSDGGRLVADLVSRSDGAAASGLRVRPVASGGRSRLILNRPVAFFIPEHLADPSRRGPGETLWAEVTLPRKGPPRPIQLGVRRGDGPIEPLEIR